MQSAHNVSWQDKSDTKTAVWHSESGRTPPKKIILVDDSITADSAYWRACAGTGMVYRGDFQNAKQLLGAVNRRADRKPLATASTMLETFHQYRARQIGRANIANRILIELQDGVCDLGRAPNIKEAVESALLTTAPGNMLISLREVLGMVGAHEWRAKGVFVKALDAKIHAHYGVFSPVRGEYLDIVDQVSMNNPDIAWDIGTGTGVVAAVLKKRGVSHVIATDTSSRALTCAAENLERLELQTGIELLEASLFPEGKADLIVCNPPWLPGKANSVMDQAVYDPKSRMLRGFLEGVAKRLNTNGEAWLVMSNLAENIGLRAPDDLQNWISNSGLRQIEKLDTLPRHSKASDSSDPLYEARSNEVTSLYRLQAVG